MMNSVAIIIPAYNEEKTIEEVIRQFSDQGQDFSIYVVDNNSKDNTKSIAEKTMKETGCSGAVFSESRQGKAWAIRTAFSRVEAEVYVMVDADLTYPAEAVNDLIAPVISGEADMVVGDRISGGEYSKENKRAFHTGGNYFVRWLISGLYGHPLKDILSGYRAFSRRFVKTYPVMCEGFELETDLTLHVLDKRIAFVEAPIQYKDRPVGSESKLSTLADGYRILTLIFNIFRHYKPFSFFGVCSLFFLFLGVVSGMTPVIDYLQHRYVYHVPLAILATGFCILSILFLSIALVLDSIANNHKYNFELRWLAFSTKDGRGISGESS